MKGLAIIPARGGSKTIPNKNLRFLAGKPLIYYCLKTASKSKFNLDIVVSTESKKISNFVSYMGYRVINRSEELSKDESTIDEVIFDIYKNLPSINEYDFLITIQPTSPLVTIDTIDNAIDEFFKNSYDTMISAVNHPHLSWKRSGLEFTPNYELRLNRQYLPDHLIETGAFVIFKPINLITGSRIYGNIGIMEVPKMESIDIDDFSDWLIAKKTLESKKIVIWTEGYNLIGMGHIYRTLLLYEKLYEHNVIIITSDRSTHGKLKFQDENVPFEVVNSQDDLIKRIQALNPDILINDVLDTTVEFVKNCKKYAKRVVNFEDLGRGGKFADAVINDLYERPSKEIGGNYYWGSKYFLLRDEFFLIGKSNLNYIVKNILVIFGGTDPSNLTLKLAKVAIELSSIYNFNFVVGQGFGSNEELMEILKSSNNINITHNSNLISNYMKKADLAFSSQGRTMLELAYMQVPTIILAQNMRELSHSFGSLENGFVNLGLGSKVGYEEIINTIEWLSKSHKIRKELRLHQSRFIPENTFNKIENIILGGLNGDY